MAYRITVDPNVHFGKPCVTGTRISVLNVLELVKEGVSFDQIIQDYYPDLGIDDIRACLQYAIEVVTVEDLHITTQA
ncbi:MAG: antitoxin [Planctomyces sp.]|nr:antitoxin [Planctomyces sp.]